MENFNLQYFVSVELLEMYPSFLYQITLPTCQLYKKKNLGVLQEGDHFLRVWQTKNVTRGGGVSSIRYKLVDYRGYNNFSQYKLHLRGAYSINLDSRFNFVV